MYDTPGGRIAGEAAFSTQPGRVSMKSPVSYRSLFLVVLFAVAGLAQTYQLSASDVDGRNGEMVYRESGVLGIKGDSKNGTVWDGNAWFDNFPGPNGTYRVYFHVVIEADGDPQYELSAGGNTLKKGRYPFLNGSVECSKSTGNHTIDCGEHTIAANSKINVWCKSVYYDKVYDCYGEYHGAYGRWKSIEFVLVSQDEDDTPPSVPGNVRQTGSTNSSIDVSWDASSDAESGINGYKVYLDGAEAASTSSTSAALTGLTRNTSYSVQVSAVNGSGLESAKSSAVTMSTADESAPNNTLFIRASDGFLSEGMTVSDNAGGALTGSPVYGVTGSTSAPSQDHSRVELTVTIPTATEWYAWGRFSFQSGTANSFWISVDGGSANRFGNGEHALGSWHWEGYMEEGGVSLGTLGQGEHTITIVTREPAAENLLDILCLSPSASYTPTDQDVEYTEIEREMVRVASPTSGSFADGQTMNIQWTADERIQNVDISLSTDGGTSWENISGSSIYRDESDWGSFAWTVAAPTSSDQCVIRVAKYEFTDPYEAGYSELFAISGGSTAKSDLSGRRFRKRACTIVGAGLRLRAAEGASVSLVDASGTVHWRATAERRSLAIPRAIADGVYFVVVRSHDVRSVHRVLLRKH